MQASDSQSWKARGKLSPRDSIPYQTVSRLPVANQVFLGFWMVDIHQEGCSQRSAPQRRHTAHLRQCSPGTPGKLSSQTGEVIKTHGPPRTVRPPCTWSPEVLGPGKGTKRMPKSVPFRST